MVARDFETEAADAVARERAAADEAAITERVNRMRAADERQQQLAKIHARHGLDPATTSARALANAEIAFDAGWRSYVGNRYGGDGGRIGAILDPDNAPLAGRDNLPASTEEIEKYRAGLRVDRDRLRREFERGWPPHDLAERLGAIDSAHQGRAHNTVAA